MLLIATPSNKFISPQTMKCVYDLDIPKYVEYYYGYKPTQVLNLIAEWGKGFDGVLFLTPDSVFTNEQIHEMVESEYDVISKPDTLDCAFVRGHVFRELPYPHFVGEQFVEHFLENVRGQFAVKISS